MWLSGLSASLQTKGSLVQFPARAHAWVEGQVPCGGHARGNHTLMFLSLSLSPSLPLTVKINKVFFLITQLLWSSTSRRMNITSCPPDPTVWIKWDYVKCFALAQAQCWHLSLCKSCYFHLKFLSLNCNSQFIENITLTYKLFSNVTRNCGL